MRAWWIMLLALAGLARRPLRVALTVLGVTIAAGALFSMVGFALGVQRQAEAPFEKLDLLKNIEIWPRRAGAEEADPDDPDDGGMAAERDGEEITQATAGEQAREDAVEREPVVIDDALLAEIQELPGVALAYPEFRMGDVEIRFQESRQRCRPSRRGIGLLGRRRVDRGWQLLQSRELPEVMITEKLVGQRIRSPGTPSARRSPCGHRGSPAGRCDLRIPDRGWRSRWSRPRRRNRRALPGRNILPPST